MTEKTPDEELAGAVERLDAAISHAEIFRTLRVSVQPDDLRTVLSALQGEGWRDIESAPKDGTPIVGWCCHAADPYCEDHKTGRLTTYGAHAEGLGHLPDGMHVLVWGGDVELGEDEGGGYIPDWWFRAGSDWEEVANPTHWRPLPKAPSHD